jgi:Glycosyl transferase 4-like domain
VVKLVYICDWLPPDFGAVGQYSLEFAREYARDDGWEVVLLGLSSAGSSRVEEQQYPGRLTIISVQAKQHDGSYWWQRLRWTIRVDLKLIAVGFRELWKCDQIIFTESPPFLLHFLVALNLLLRKRLVYRITDFYPECIMAALGTQAWALRLFHRWTCFLRRRVDQIQVLGHDQTNRLLETGVSPERIVLKRDRSPAAITGTEQPLTPPPAIASYAVLLYSGNYGVAHEVDTFLEGYRAHHRSGSGRVALWLNAVGAGADRVEQGCHASGLPIARTRPLPLALLPRLLVTPDAHLITLRPEFTGFVLPSKVYGCIASGRSILYVGEAASDVHYLCERAPGLPIYRQVDPGDPAGVAEALEEIAASAAAATPPDQTRKAKLLPAKVHARAPKLLEFGNATDLVTKQ